MNGKNGYIGKEDAMKLFIDKVPESHRKKILINVGMEQNANHVAISFCLNELGPDSYETLLITGYGKNNHYSHTLENLVTKHCFKETIDLLKSWGSVVSGKIENLEQEDEDFKRAAYCLYNDYASFIYGMLDRMTLPKKDIAEMLCAIESSDSLAFCNISLT